MKKLFLCLAVVFVAACNNHGEAVSGTIAIYTDECAVLEKTEITFNEGDSVLAITRRVTRDNRIHMDYAGIGITAYVKGIDNLYEFDKGPESGWQYYINGMLVQTGAGMYKPSDGDVIIWQYVITP
jgi:hypothetical protein